MPQLEHGQLGDWESSLRACACALSAGDTLFSCARGLSSQHGLPKEPVLECQEAQYDEGLA